MFFFKLSLFHEEHRYSQDFRQEAFVLMFFSYESSDSVYFYMFVFGFFCFFLFLHGCILFFVLFGFHFFLFTFKEVGE